MNKVHHVRVLDVFRLVTDSLWPSSNMQWHTLTAGTSTTAHD
jgi:hypothetical protein